MIRLHTRLTKSPVLAKEDPRDAECAGRVDGGASCPKILSTGRDEDDYVA
jgi:hypothetical protein